MEYNTEQPRLVLPEHGRNIQRMVNHAKSLEDRDARNKAAATIVHIIAQMNPQQKDQSEFIHKVWDHIHIMADFELDVDSPYPPPIKEDIMKKPERLDYPVHNITYKHYGKNVELMIKKAVQMESGPEKDFFVNALASYMKMAYRKWNDEKVSDQVILNHLEELSGGKIKLDAIVDLHKNFDPNAQKQSKSQPNKGQQNKNQQRGSKNQKNRNNKRNRKNN